jgi:hypothetical protein
VNLELRTVDAPMRPHQCLLSAAAVAVLAATPAIGAPTCKPEFVATDVMFSQAHGLRRAWSARIAVDAARCATDHGRFEIHFVRIKETAPDMRFTEQFTWTPGVIVVATDFAADEAVLTYSIRGETCPCR